MPRTTVRPFPALLASLAVAFAAHGQTEPATPVVDTSGGEETAG